MSEWIHKQSLQRLKIAELKLRGTWRSYEEGEFGVRNPEMVTTGTGTGKGASLGGGAGAGAGGAGGAGAAGGEEEGKGEEEEGESQRQGVLRVEYPQGGV